LNNLVRTRRNLTQFFVLVSHPVLFILAVNGSGSEVRLRSRDGYLQHWRPVRASLRAFTVVRASVADAAMRKRRSVPRARVFVCASVRGARSYGARAPNSFFYRSNLMMGHGSESPMPSGLPSTSTSDGSHHGTTARTFGSFCILYFHHLMRCPSKMGIFGRYLYGRGHTVMLDIVHAISRALRVGAHLCHLDQYSWIWWPRIVSPRIRQESSLCLLPPSYLPSIPTVKTETC
jgi:hypothetical protein